MNYPSILTNPLLRKPPAPPQYDNISKFILPIIN